MRKTAALIFTLSTLILIGISGCSKNDNPFKPGENSDNHPFIWQYKYNQHATNSDVIPAMDENGDIFFSIQNTEYAKNVYVFANDKDGNALWDKQYSSSNWIVISRIMYIDNKVVFKVLVSDELDYHHETIYCLNANTGSELWHYSPNFEYERDISAMALTSKYLVLAAKWGGIYPDIDELHFFDLSSGALTKSVNLGDDEIENIGIAGNDIYLAIYSKFSDNSTGPKIMKMNMLTDEVIWTYSPEFADDVDYVFEQRNIAIDANGRVICLIRKKTGYAQSDIYIINNDGGLASKIDGYSGNREIYDIIIDNDDNFYVALPGFTKYSPVGNELWQFYTDTSVPNSNFLSGGIIGDNNIIYHAENGGILNVDTVGNIAWAVYDQTNFVKPGYPLLTNDGNLVVVGDLYVSCVQGDGAKIQNKSWPRVYCNNGNTSSRP